MLDLLKPYALYIASGAVVVAGGLGYWKGSEHASTRCEAARAAALEASNEALAAFVEKTDEQLAQERAENVRINNLLDIEAETANAMAANFQEEINGIRTNTEVDPDCPPVRYDGVRQLLIDAARGRPADTPTSTDGDAE